MVGSPPRAVNASTILASPPRYIIEYLGDWRAEFTPNCMEAIKILEQYWEQLKRFVIYAQYCVESDLHAPVCRDFWLSTAYAAFGIGILIIALIAKRVIKEQLEFNRNRKRLEARAIVASAEEIEAASWKGDALDGNIDKLPVEELAEQFRQALNKDSKPATLS